MKKTYQRPAMDVETYSLDMSIASHCGIVVSNGPAMGEHQPCDDYLDPFDGVATFDRRPHNVQFYEDTNCDCYTTGGDYGYWTS